MRPTHSKSFPSIKVFRQNHNLKATALRCAREIREGKDLLGEDDTQRDCTLTSSLVFCVPDYAEELRFYLIHMTEVRKRAVLVCVCFRERGGQRRFLMRAAYFVCEPEGQLTLVEITLQRRHCDQQKALMKMSFLSVSFSDVSPSLTRLCLTCNKSNFFIMFLHV